MKAKTSEPIRTSLIVSVTALLTYFFTLSGTQRQPGASDEVKTEWRAEAIERGNQIWDSFNMRPLNENSFNVLVVGNSITCHPMREGVWSSINGMAASSHKTDYLHIFMEHVHSVINDRPVELFIECGPGVEHALDRLHSSNHHRNYDLVIIQRGENDQVFDEEFMNRYKELVVAVPARCGTIVVSDWYHHDRAAFQKEVASAAGASFVDLREIATDPSNHGNGGPFHHSGVRSHPNDMGMAAIAKSLIETFDEATFLKEHQ